MAYCRKVTTRMAMEPPVDTKKNTHVKTNDAAPPKATWMGWKKGAGA